MFYLAAIDFMVFTMVDRDRRARQLHSPDGRHNQRKVLRVRAWRI